ncbi:unnamed protein product [Camellia sinensis]
MKGTYIGRFVKVESGGERHWFIGGDCQRWYREDLEMWCRSRQIEVEIEREHSFSNILIVDFGEEDDKTKGFINWTRDFSLRISINAKLHVEYATLLSMLSL